MAKEYAKEFYNSTSWISTRNAYLNNVNGLCERCLEKGKITSAEIIHHKIYITPANISDTNITLNWDNLQAVCRECHKQIHDGDTKATINDLTFNMEGDIVYADNISNE